MIRDLDYGGAVTVHRGEVVEVRKMEKIRFEDGVPKMMAAPSSKHKS
jgi:hypothetical protein